jgi:hypothetical protein
MKLKILIWQLLALLLCTSASYSQTKSTLEKKVTVLEKKVKELSDRTIYLEQRIKDLERTKGTSSPQVLREQWIQSNRDMILNWINNLAANAYQFKIRPKTMGGGNGIFTGYKIPNSLVENDEASFTAEVFADSVMITGISKQKLGSISATMDDKGRLKNFILTEEFK